MQTEYPVIGSVYTKPEKRTEVTLYRHCEERSDEAIQRPFLASYKATGLLRRYAPRITLLAMTGRLRFSQ